MSYLFGRVNCILAALIAFTAFSFAPAAAEAAYQASATTTLNFRAGPGTNYQVIGSIPNGRIVTVFNCTEGYNWCDISFSGQRGWASGKYLAYAGSGQYYGQPIYRTGVYIGLPLIWHSFPIYRPRPPHYRPPPGNRPPGNRPPGYRPPKPSQPIARPPRPSQPIARPPGNRPGNRPAGTRPSTPNRPAVRPPAGRPPATRPPNYRPRPGARPGGRPSGGRRR